MTAPVVDSTRSVVDLTMIDPETIGTGVGVVLGVGRGDAEAGAAIVGDSAGPLELHALRALAASSPTTTAPTTREVMVMRAP